MRIAIVAQPYYPQSGGVSEHVHHTALELRKLGHETDIVTSRFATERDSGKGVVRVGRNVMIPNLGAFANVNAGPHLARELSDALGASDYDVFHVHEPLCPTLPLLAVRRAREETVVVGTFHGSGPRASAYRLFRGCLRRYWDRLDVRVSVSEAARRFVSRHFEGNCSIVPNGVDPKRFHPGVPPLEDHASGRPTILFVGKFYPRKGIPILFRALPKVAAEVPGVRLLIVGSGPLARWYRSLARKAPCEVVFLGELSENEIPRAYRTADVFVAPSTGQESFGIVHLEAMASGVPIVASNIEGYREILDSGREALLFANRNPDALAAALVRVLRDKSLAESMSLVGREKAERFSWARVTQELEALYLESLDRRQRIRLAS